MTPARGNAKIIVILIALVALLGIGWYIQKMETKQEVVNNNNAIDLVQPAESPCGLVVENPLPMTDVSVPFAVTGAIHTNSELDCRWTIFEGQGGTIEIRNANTNAIILSKTPMMLTQMDWMDRAIAGQDVDFATQVSSLDVAYTGPALIILEEDNPSGEGIPDVLMITVNIQ